jgi:hypothetical protein
MSADRIVFASAIFGWAFLLGHMAGEYRATNSQRVVENNARSIGSGRPEVRTPPRLGRSVSVSPIDLTPARGIKERPMQFLTMNERKEK